MSRSVHQSSRNRTSFQAGSSYLTSCLDGNATKPKVVSPWPLSATLSRSSLRCVSRKSVSCSRCAFTAKTNFVSNLCPSVKVSPAGCHVLARRPVHSFHPSCHTGCPRFDFGALSSGAIYLQPTSTKFQSRHPLCQMEPF